MAVAVAAAAFVYAVAKLSAEVIAISAAFKLIARNRPAKKVKVVFMIFLILKVRENLCIYYF
jgi:hypothetical protein